MQTVKGVKVRCIKLLKNKVYKFARYTHYSFNTRKYLQTSCKYPFIYKLF